MRKGEIGSKSHASSPLLSPFTKAINPSYTCLGKREGTGYKTDTKFLGTLLASGMSQTMS